LFETDSEGIVSVAWLLLLSPDEISANRLSVALSQLASKWQLILVDWSWGRVIKIDDKKGLDKYLAHIADS
jgi:hypothetical protein